jgi:hypothetical protein
MTLRRCHAKCVPTPWPRDAEREGTPNLAVEGKQIYKSLPHWLRSIGAGVREVTMLQV